MAKSLWEITRSALPGSNAWAVRKVKRMPRRTITIARQERPRRTTALHIGRTYVPPCDNQVANMGNLGEKGFVNLARHAPNICPFFWRQIQSPEVLWPVLH